MTTANTFGYKLASKGTRFLASFVEGIIFVLVSLGFYQLIGISFEDYLNSDFQLIDIAYSAISGLVLGAILYPLFIGNLGHRIFNLKVISSEDGID